MHLRGVALAAGLLVMGFCSGSAFAAPVSAAGGLPSPHLEVEQARSHHWNHRHGRRCWWENRRVRDHRGRWVTRRVQVCIR